MRSLLRDLACLLFTFIVALAAGAGLAAGLFQFAQFACGAPALKEARSLEKELPGSWRMLWAGSEYDAVFGADGGYAYRHRWHSYTEAGDDYFTGICSDWHGDNNWHAERDGSLWVREGEATYRWHLAPTAFGWQGHCRPRGAAADFPGFRVELHRD